jgi:putative thioredoxin
MPEWIVDVGDADFEREVLQRSQRTPVVADFWAPWCAPCRALGPILERLAEQHAGAFVLARVNVDEAPELAAAFGIRSIPAVRGFRRGRLEAQFEGVQPESEVRRFVESMLPSEADRLAREGTDAARAGDAAAAAAAFERALDLDPRQAEALLGLAELRAEAEERAEALELLARMPGGAPEAEPADRLAARLRTEIQGGQDEAALRARIVTAPGDLRARIELGRALAARARYEEALSEWLEAVRRDPHFADDAARRAMLDIFTLLGDHDPLTQRFRTELARALFR